MDTIETTCVRCGAVRDMLAHPECQTCKGAEGRVKSMRQLEREAREYRAAERRAELRYADLDYRREVRGWED